LIDAVIDDAVELALWAVEVNEDTIERSLARVALSFDSFWALR